MTALAQARERQDQNGLIRGGLPPVAVGAEQVSADYIRGIQAAIDFVTNYEDNYHPQGLQKRIASDMQKLFLLQGE